MIKGFGNFVKRAASVVLGHPAKFIFQSLGGGMGFWGKSITTETAMGIPTVYACVGIRAQSVAAIPLKLYKRTANGKKQAVEHPAYKMTSLMANPYMTSFMAQEYMQTCLDLKGNAYARVVWEGGYPVALYPIDPIRVRIKIQNGIKTFHIAMADGSEKEFQKEEILHISNVSLDGVYGASVLALHRETLAKAKAQAEYAVNFFDNAARPSGAFSAPGELSQQAFDRLKAQLKEEWAGSQNAGKPLLLENDLKFQPISMNAEDMAYIEQMKFSQLDICQIFAVPPHMVGILDRATFSNIEEQNTDFYRRTLMALYVRWEMELNTTLLLPKEWAKWFFKFDARAFLRGNTLMRYQVYAIARNWGIMSLNEIRELEDMDLLDPEIGDVHLEPLNMKKAGEDPPEQDQKDGQPGEPKGPNKANTKKDTKPAEKKDIQEFVSLTVIRDGFEDIFDDHLTRMVSKHCLSLRKKLPKATTSDEWRAGYCAFFLDERDKVRDTLNKPIAGYCRMMGVSDGQKIGQIADEFVASYMERAVADLDGIDFEPARVELQLDKWLTSRAVSETKELFAILERAA